MSAPLFVSYVAKKAGDETRGWIVADVSPLVTAEDVVALHRMLEEKTGFDPGSMTIIFFGRLEQA